MAENITLVTYAGSSVTPQHDAVLADLELPGNGIIYGCNVTIKNATTLHIAAGMGVIYGREFEIIDNDITVPLSTQGALLGQLYIHMDLSNTTEPIQLLIQTGSAREELIDDPTINTSAGVTEMQMATFTIDTSTLDNLEVTFSVLENLKESVKDLKSEVVKSITRNGTTFTAKNEEGETLFTFTQQDNDTTKGNGISTKETKNGSGTTLNKEIPANTTMDNALGIILNGLNALDVVNGIQNNDIPWYGTSSTAAATAAKVAATTDVRLGTLAVGQKVRIKFTNANTAAAPTLNVDGKGAKAIKAYGTTAPTVMWEAGDVVDFTYDGTNWIMGATAGMIEQLNSDLSAKVAGFTSGDYTKVTGLAYDSTNKKLGLKVNGADTVIPFSSSGKKFTFYYGPATHSNKSIYKIEDGTLKYSTDEGGIWYTIPTNALFFGANINGTYSGFNLWQLSDGSIETYMTGVATSGLATEILSRFSSVVNSATWSQSGNSGRITLRFKQKVYITGNPEGTLLTRQAVNANTDFKIYGNWSYYSNYIQMWFYIETS